MDFDTGLERVPANHQPLTPLLFLERAHQAAAVGAEAGGGQAGEGR